MSASDCRPDRPEWFSRALSYPRVVDLVDVDGCRIAVTRWGDPDNPPLLMVHGRSANGSWWDHVAPLLADDYCVSALDLSGHGDSGWRPTYSYDGWASEVQAVAGLAGHPIVIAHSFGGRLAVRAARRAPGRFAGLVLLDTNLSAQAPRATDRSAPSRTDAGQAIRTYATFDEALAQFRLRGGGTTSARCILEHIASRSLRRTPDGLIWKRDRRTNRPIDDRPGIDELCGVSTSTALIRAENGNVGPELLEAYRRILGPAAPIVELPASGHHLMLDQPLALVAALRAVLFSLRELP